MINHDDHENLRSLTSKKPSRLSAIFARESKTQQNRWPL
jgi:hypothetical protein